MVKATEPLLTPEQVAERLQVTAEAVHGWLRKGELSGFKVGKRLWRVPVESVERFLKGNEPVAKHGRRRRRASVEAELRREGLMT